MIDTSLLLSARDAWAVLAGRYGWLRWAVRWGLSLGSLLSGIVTLIVFRRGADYFPWILGYLLLLWVGGVVFANVRQALDVRNQRIIGVVVDYTIQGLHQDLLLFLLPIYYGSTTLSSPNALFFLLLLAAALLTNIDPWYRATVLRYPWMAQALFAFGLFSSMNVGLPFVRVRSGWALLFAIFLSSLALIPAIRRRLSLSWRNATLATAVGGLLLAAPTWWARSLIPPGPLHISTATFARSVEGLVPVERVREVSVARVRAWGGLVCFTAVSAPAGLREPIFHIWQRDGTLFARIALSPIKGGRPGGYRTYSRRSDLGPDPVGRWTVDVVTGQGQLIGRVWLVVTH